jgi:phage terminase large subunit-like protein
MFARTPSELDELSPEVLLGGEGVVCVAAQREVFLCVLAVPRDGPEVVELEAVSFGAASSQGVGVSAARFVALEDSTTDRGGDVSTAPAR